MLPIYCAIVDPGQHHIAKHIWSAAVQVAIPGLSTVDIHGYAGSIRDRFPGMLSYVYIPPMDMKDAKSAHVELRIMAMDGMWSKRLVRAYPVLDLSDQCIATLQGVSGDENGGTLTIEEGGRFERLGLGVLSLDSGETWDVGARSQFQLPEGWYRLDARNQLLRRALTPAALEKFRIENGLEHRQLIALEAGHAVCKIAVVDELNRPVHNYFLRLRPDDSDEWTVWAGTLSRSADIFAMVREGTTYQMEVDAIGCRPIHTRIVPQRSDAAAARCDDITVVVQEKLTSY